MTVNGQIFRTFQEACEAHGLLGDDEEWNDALKQVSTWATSKQLRDLFITIILFYEVTSPKELFEENWRAMSDDIEYQFRRALNVEKFSMPENDLKNYVLIALEELLVQNCTSLAEKNLPQPTGNLSSPNANRLIFEELNYNLRELQEDHIQTLGTLNLEQREIYIIIKQSVDKDEGRIFFISGHGGTGKTYLWKTIIAGIRSNKQIVLVVASSGIDSLLLPGGRTAHSRFKIPITIDQWSTCEIKKRTQLASLLKQTSLIIWDEAPMVHRFCIEALDKSLRDIFNDLMSQGRARAFGGKTVVFGGDFRQIYPVIPSGAKADILNATMCNSQIWHGCEVSQISEAKLSQIEPGIRAFIVVRIVRLWKTILPPYNEFISIDFLAVDDQKNAMHGTIPSEYSADFEDHLMEGNVYKINMFQVTKRKQSHNVVPVQKMLYLSSTTRIEKINDDLDKYPQHYFQHATMDNIIARTDHEYFMTDVIGLLISVTPISSVQISPKQVSANITGQSSAKTFTANKRDIFIKLLRFQEETSTIEVMSNKEITMGHFKAHEMKIEDLHYLNAKEIKGQKFKVHAKISSINMRRGWYYKSWSMCTFRVDDGNDSFNCARHGLTTPKLVMRLNLTLEVESGKLEAVMFGALAEKLSQYQLTSSVISKGVQNDRLPEELKAITDQEYIFTVGLTDQASDQLLLKYKVFAFISNSQAPFKDNKFKGKDKAGSGSEDDETEDAAILTSDAIPTNLFSDESPAKKLKSSVSRRIIYE
ncbi:ATP-dependent DNA helicase pif4 [Phtheirospermum japonicum]|uniref:ATP-dependent DNA helicase n=1 Tax=Phtheirospermum japonicum TaxID=374723 RepID=A0A830C0R8_9LAMI|nr:ATP-dependent DNA helicase pif4 [Phtheirospermum japonicum]